MDALKNSKPGLFHELVWRDHSTTARPLQRLPKHMNAGKWDHELELSCMVGLVPWRFAVSDRAPLVSQPAKAQPA